MNHQWIARRASANRPASGRPLESIIIFDEPCDFRADGVRKEKEPLSSKSTFSHWRPFSCISETAALMIHATHVPQDVIGEGSPL
jgi:hypothetical protein